jgi:hypothetical protein
MDFLLPYARLELLIRTMRTRTWEPERGRWSNTSSSGRN